MCSELCKLTRHCSGMPWWVASLAEVYYLLDHDTHLALQPKLFAKSETINIRIMSSTRSPSRIVFSQTQRYKNRFMDKVCTRFCHLTQISANYRL